MNKNHVEVFKLLGHPARMRIVELMATQEIREVQQLFDALGYKDAKSWFHLNLLRHSGLVESKRLDGSRLTLSLDLGRLEAACISFVELLRLDQDQEAENA